MDKWNTFNRPVRDEKSKGFGTVAPGAGVGLLWPDCDSPETESELLSSTAAGFSSDGKKMHKWKWLVNVRTQKVSSYM